MLAGREKTMKKFTVTFGDYDGDILLLPADDKRLDGARGMTEFGSAEIYIANNLSNRLTFRTIVHELTHYALFCYDKSADDTNTEICFKNEEELCRFNEKVLPDIYTQARDAEKFFQK